MTPAADFPSVERTLAAASAAPHWYVAFSGGLDSSVLLHLLALWRASRPTAPAITALHVNHQLQPQAADWARHCAGYCATLGVPLQVLCANIQIQGEGLEAAARTARYDLFAGVLEPGAILFTAHHLDDQVETFFLRLMRGAGVRGLAAMPVERPLGQGSLLRPLLEYSRDQLEAYAREHGLSWVEDPSNDDSGLDRNFLRRQVLPLLGERWPGYRRTVARAAGHMAAAGADLARQLPQLDLCESVLGDPGIRVEALRGEPEGVAVQMLREWLRGFGCAAPDQSALAEFLRQLRESAADAAPLLDTGAYQLQRFRDAVFLLPCEASLPEGITLAPGEPVVELMGVGRLALQKSANGFCLAQGERISVRWRGGGERCRPLWRGASASLKQLAQEAAIPPWWRRRLPLLYAGDELVAVGGLGLCHSSRLAAGPGSSGLGCELYWQPGNRPSPD